MNKSKPGASVASCRALAALAAILVAAVAPAEESGGIMNFIEYTDRFASSGQPTAAQLTELGQQGYQRVVYLAWTDNESSLDGEDRLVKSLGMEYMHIPVEWTAPTASDFYLFAGAMQRAPEKKTLLHCQANYRAAAFSFLYRVLYEDIPVAEAKRDLNEIWSPNETWRDLIFDVLDEHGISPHCDGCDWTPPPEPEV
ncbi:MAG: protein tyrosine phosphatase family protein [Woeseia sp.]